ncbi:MAG: cyanophycinase [Acidobacteriota bacterium]|nr:cyanophycinase [Acidobacteriota bacterium]
MSRGHIIPIGGAEERLRDPEILHRFANLCGGREAKIAIIPTASQLPETGPGYERVFRDLGVGAARSLPLETREDCNDPRWLGRLENAQGVFLTGGNQLRLSTTIGGTEVAEILRRRSAEDGLHIAGTSAGAAFLSEHMIAFGAEGSTPHADMVTLAPGLGLTKTAVIDQHFRERDRLGRLLTALAYNPRPVGIGLDEDTAAFIGPDDRLEVFGSGAITVVDPSDLQYSSMDSAKQSEAVCMLNIRLHILIEGATFDIGTREATPPPAPGIRPETELRAEATVGSSAGSSR